uniref:VWFD domain-containing protein n=1 Tax=Denticeps clupeoides TaxID=299321 RepID=A0AAY4BZF2_9TELE
MKPYQARKVCGMCGNFNGNQQDDLSMRNGSLARNVDALGKSWRVPNVAGEANCKDECTGECQESTLNNAGTPVLPLVMAAPRAKAPACRPAPAMKATCAAETSAFPKPSSA